MTGTAWKLPGYVIEDLLGAGAQAQVWRGRVAATGEPVALKRIRPVDTDHARGARSEGAMLAALEHPNLVRLHEVVSFADCVVLVLDYASGGSLADLVAARGRLTPGEVISALSPIGAALDYLHTAGVVHGDVTPSNVLFTGAGAPLLADLGVARIAGDGAVARATLAFVDPSVAAGAVPTARSDVFMLGGVALAALTGTAVWAGSTPDRVLALATAAELSGIADRLAAAGVPEPMAAVVRRALHPLPHRRGTAADFALDLRCAADPVAVDLGAGRARPAPRPGQPASTRGSSGPAHRGGRHAARPVGSRVAVPLPPRTPDSARPAVGQVAAVTPPNGVPLTREVRARPLPARRVPVRWYRRRSWRFGLAVLTVVLAGAATWLRWPRGQQARPAGTAISAPHMTPRPAHSTASTAATTGSAAATGPTAATGLVSAELGRLDRVRARAFAERAPQLLAQVYASETLRAQDAELVSRLVPPGCGLRGARTSFRDLVINGSGAGWQVTVTATLAPSILDCGGVGTTRAPGSGPVRLRIVLVRVGHAYRIASQTRT